MKFSIINKTENILLIKKEWNELFIKGDYSVFQSFDFNYYSWKHELSNNNKNQLAILVIRRSKGIVAIFPFYIDHNRQLRFINDLHFDFCDFITKESITFSEVYNYLKQEVDFKSIRLINVKKEANIYKSVRDLKTIDKVIKSFSEYSILNLHRGNFPYNAHYRSHQKNRINKAFKKHKEKQSVIAAYPQDSFPKKEILLLKETMILLGVRKDNFLTHERLLLIESLYNSGIIILHIMKSEDKISAINIVLKKSSSEYMFWIDLFDDAQMINISSYINFMKYSSLEEKSVIINFGRGRYFYKASNFAPEFHKLYQMVIFSNKWQKLRFIIFGKIIGLLVEVYKKIKK